MLLKLLFESGKLPREVFVGSEHLPQTYKYTHHNDAGTHGHGTVQYICRHDGSVLRKGVGQFAPSSTSAF